MLQPSVYDRSGAAFTSACFRHSLQIEPNTAEACFCRSLQIELHTAEGEDVTVEVG